MQLIDNRSYRDPALNLALEEFLVGRFGGGETILLFYSNDPTVVIGRNQVPHIEVNMHQLQQRQVTIVRRISGGGAVYHGPGNINFGLIEAHGATPFPSPGDAVRPVRDALQALGLPARLNTRHDILVNGRKVTGTAQYRAQGKSLTHGTLLVSADLESLQQVLVSDSDVPFYQGRASIRSPVTNLIDYRPDLTTSKVRAALVESFAALHGSVSPVALTTEDWAEVGHLAQTKYRSWDWAVGRSPQFTIHRRARFPWGWCEALIRIRRGIVTQLDLTTVPPAGPRAFAALGASLEGCRYHPKDVAQTLKSIGLDPGDARGPVAVWLCAPFCWWR